MSLTTYIGNHPNILEETPEHARLIKMARPVITDEELNRLCNIREAGFPSRQALPPVPGRRGRKGSAGDAGQPGGIRRGAGQVRRAHPGADGPQHRPRLPSRSQPAGLLRGAPRLAAAGLRSDVGLILETGEARETMHFALLLGFGATGGQSVPGSGDGHLPGRAAGLPAGRGEGLR